MSSTPTIEQRASQPYVAIPAAVTVPEVGEVLPPLIGELDGWLAARAAEPVGAPFFKYNLIHMDRDLQVEVGMPVPAELAGDDRVRPGVLPAGRYAVLIHTGPYDGVVDACRRLLQWGDEQGLAWDMSQTEDGERWGARIEAYPTDPEAEPDPQRWVTELAFRLA